MVFRSISVTEAEAGTQQKPLSRERNKPENYISATAMAAAATVKQPPHQQPLHNFSLQDLKWSMNHSSNHRLRKPPSSSSAPAAAAAADAAENSGVSLPDGLNLVPDRRKAESSDKKSKIFIRIRTKVSDAGDQNSAAGDDDVAGELIPKTWNLRPRRAVTKPQPPSSNNASGGAASSGGVAVEEIRAHHQPTIRSLESSRLNGNDVNKQKKEKEIEKEKQQQQPKLSIPLTKEEIEEDVYALTGSKPARRPKKRAKHVQKQLDCLFPAVWLSTVTVDAYRVPDAPSKG